MYLKTCIVCGREFETDRHNRRCCDKKCSERRIKQVKQDSRLNCEKRRKRKGTWQEELISLNAEAKSKGMTYGEYMAWKEFNK